MMKRAALLITAASLGLASCGVHKTNTPSLTGPSGFGLSVGISASPDSISQDGGSQSSIRVTARDAGGQSIVGETFRLDLMVKGSQVDFGTLSARTVVTGSDGTASAIYTAPPASQPGTILPTCDTSNAAPGALAGQCVTVVATPISGPGTTNDFTAAQSQAVLIHLMPVGLIVPTALAVPQFTITPASPAANAPVVFDATSSCAGPLNSSGACPAGSGTVVSYQWTFGDGLTGAGAVATHTYSTAQAYSVTLTITTDSGGSAQLTKSITVGGSTTAPTASFVISPTAPAAGQTVLFNADASRAGAGHTLTQFSWNFGDTSSSSNTASGFQPTHVFQFPGSYTAVLTIADDAGQRTTTSQVVTVVSGLVAHLSLSLAGSNIVADGSASTPTPGSKITSYKFSWTDSSGTPQSRTVTPPTTSFTITGLSSGPYTVLLTVTDDSNNFGSDSKSITVP